MLDQHEMALIRIAERALARRKAVQEAPAPRTVWFKILPLLGHWRTVREIAELSGCECGSVHSAIGLHRSEVQCKRLQRGHQWRLKARA